jgi:hypothetical protein
VKVGPPGVRPSLTVIAASAFSWHPPDDGPKTG